MHKPQVESVEVVVRADGWVELDHARWGPRLEVLISECLISDSTWNPDGSKNSPSENSPSENLECPTLAPREPETSAVAAGSSDSAAAQPEQYTAGDPAARNESLPQRSQYLVSNTSVCNTSAVAVCAAAVLLLLCALMHTC